MPYEPVEIPVPTRRAFLRDMQKVAPPDEPADHDDPEQDYLAGSRSTVARSSSSMNISDPY